MQGQELQPIVAWREPILRSLPGFQSEAPVGAPERPKLIGYERLQELLARPVEHIDPTTTARIFQEIPGLLPRLNVYKEGRQK